MSDIYTPVYERAKDVFEKRNYFVPIYQRPYSWGEEQVKVLCNDLLCAFENNPDADYFVGNMIFSVTDQKENTTLCEVIDGQQRITTFCLLLLAFYCLLMNKEQTCDGDKAAEIASDIEKLLWKGESNESVVLKLGPLENRALEILFSECKDKKGNISTERLTKRVENDNEYKKKLVKNFQLIVEYLSSDKIKDKLTEFAEYVLDHAGFIVMASNTGKKEVFSIFESINSKGKKLEEIDLIKSYIFSQLDEANYSDYLTKWGELIEKTDDRLHDYISIFVKANIKYYRQTITCNRFKELCENQLPYYYGSGHLQENIKKLINDLVDNVHIYRALKHPDEYKDIRKHKFRFYFELLCKTYEQPLPLLFRTLSEYEKKKLNQDDVIRITEDVCKFMVIFVTLCDNESKDAVTTFSNMMNEIFNRKEVSTGLVEYHVYSFLQRNIDKQEILNKLSPKDAYGKNKALFAALIKLYDVYAAEGKISYDYALNVFTAFGKSYTLDHLLPQEPDQNNSDLSYYRDKSTGNLCLKDNHDFDDAKSGTNYDDFIRKYLNVIGNLEPTPHDVNSSRNNGTHTKDGVMFNTYKQVKERNESICNFLVDNIFTFPDLSKSTYEPGPSGRYLPKFKELLEEGIINRGDELYFEGYDPDETKATLISIEKVNYKGEKMSINSWSWSVRNRNKDGKICLVGGDGTTVDQMRKTLWWKRHKDEKTKLNDSAFAKQNALSFVKTIYKN